jgi:hypothetical protein
MRAPHVSVAPPAPCRPVLSLTSPAHFAAIARHRCHSGHADPCTGFSGAPRADPWSSGARRTSTPTCPRAQLRAPPPNLAVNSPAWHPQPTRALGEHPRDLPFLLRYKP